MFDLVDGPPSRSFCAGIIPTTLQAEQIIHAHPVDGCWQGSTLWTRPADRDSLVRYMTEPQ